jgi:osmotically-inducible protein OsmY
MANRYGDRDYDRGQQNSGRRWDADYDRSVGERYGYGRDENERERYDVENRWRGQSGTGSSAGSSGNYQAGREEYGASGRWENDRDYTGSGERDRGYGGYGRGSNATQRYGGPSSYSQQGNYQSGSRYGQSSGSGSNYGQAYGGARGYDYDRSGYDYGQGQGRSSYDYGQSQGRSGYDYGQGRSGYGSGQDYNQDRGWWDRASDAVASWFGDEEAERRRRMDEQRQQYRGRGPKGYRRSDERIKEDINDRLSEGYLDASDIEVAVQNGEVSLTGTVNNRSDKRRAEDIAEYVTGVTHVENRIRVKQSDLDRYTGTEGTSTLGTMGTTGTGATGSTGATGTSTSSSAATGTTGTARGKTAGS